MPQTAKLFQNGRSQAVRLPAEFRFEGREVLIRRDVHTGDVILSAKISPANDWDSFLASRRQIAEAGELDDFILDRDDRPADRDDPFA